MRPSLVSVAIASILMKPPYENVVPGLAAVMMVVPWIGCLPAGTAGLAACAACTCVTCSWVVAIWVCCCCCDESSSCTCRSSSATRASSAFSLAVCANAIPGAIRATKSAAASGRRAMSAERWVITPPERLMAALRG